MAILQFPQNLLGQNDVNPSRRPMKVTDNLATVTAAGYLNSNNLPSIYSVSHNDIIWMQYSCDSKGKNGTFGIFTVAVSAGIITLSEYQSASGVNATLPTTVGNIATYSNTTGDITQNPATAYTSLALQSGTNVIAGGSLVANSPTAAQSNLKVQASNNINNTNFIITNDGSGANSGATNTYILPPITQASTNFLVTNGPQTMFSNGSITLATSSGTVSAGNVIINTQSGKITTAALTLVQYATTTFTLTNTLITATSKIFFNISGGTNTTPGVSVFGTTTSTSSTVTICNLNSTALNGTLIIDFLVV